MTVLFLLIVSISVMLISNRMEIDRQRKRFDKSDVKYTDGDNT